MPARVWRGASGCWRDESAASASLGSCHDSDCPGNTDAHRLPLSNGRTRGGPLKPLGAREWGGFVPRACDCAVGELCQVGLEALSPQQSAAPPQLSKPEAGPLLAIVVCSALAGFPCERDGARGTTCAAQWQMQKTAPSPGPRRARTTPSAPRSIGIATMTLPSAQPERPIVKRSGSARKSAPPASALEPPSAATAASPAQARKLSGPVPVVPCCLRHPAL